MYTIQNFFDEHTDLKCHQKNFDLLYAALEGKEFTRENCTEALSKVRAIMDSTPTVIPEPAIFAAADKVFQPDEIVMALNKVLDEFPTVERSKYNMQQVVQWVFQNNVLPIYKNLRAGVRILEPALTHVSVPTSLAIPSIAPPSPPPQELKRRLPNGEMALPSNASDFEVKRASVEQLKDFLKNHAPKVGVSME